MLNIKRIFFVFLFCLLLVNGSVNAYSTEEYSIEIPNTYSKISEGNFSNEEGTTIHISSEKNDLSEFGTNILESDVYNNDTLKELKSGFEQEMYKYVYSGISNAIKSFYPEIIKDELDTINKSITYNLIDSEIVDMVNYKAFRVIGKINILNTINYVLEEYLIYTENYITVIAIGTLNEGYFNTSEYSKILDSLIINDNTLPTQITSSMIFDNYMENPVLLILDLGLTIFLYCIVPVILRFKNGKYEYYKGRKIIIINNVVVCIFIILFQSSQNIEITSGATAIFYYYINKQILLKNKKEKQNIIEQEENDCISIECKVCGKEIPFNDYGTCKECYQEISKKIEETKTDKSLEAILIECKVCGKEIPFNEYGTCEECHEKILKRMEDKKIDRNSEENGKENIVLKQKYCTNCGEKIEESWSFCNNCGNKLK